tara:strand:- start:1479 stop:2333 length:855 start_codon:yes stop_codon:yes gene_type:complete
MVVVAQLVRAPGCGSGGRRFETALPPIKINGLRDQAVFLIFFFKLRPLLIINQSKMKKIIFIFLLFISFSLSAQNIVWEQVGLKVSQGTSAFVLELVEGFYTSIEKPEGVAISLDAVWYKPEGYETTHFLTFAGSAEDLGRLRELRSGEVYQKYNQDMLKFSKITSITSGSTLMRMNLDKGNYPISQIWQFGVENPQVFVNEFSTLVRSFPQDGYLSIGLINHGGSSNGESHYIYTTHKDYTSALSWGPRNEKEQAAFIKFQQKISSSSEYLGTITLSNVKSWN